MASEKPIPAELRNKPTQVEFLYSYHNLKNIERILEKLEDSDFLFLENVGLSQDEREKLEDRYNLILAKESDVIKEDKEERDAALREFSGSSSFSEVLIYRLAGSGKTIRLIDVGGDNPAFLEILKCRRQEIQIGSEIASGDIDASYETFKKYINDAAAADETREEYVSNQLAQMLPQVPAGKKATVLQGAVHTSTRHRVKDSPNVKIRMVFEKPTFVFSPSSWLLRLHKSGRRGVTEQEYRQGFIGAMIFYMGISRVAPALPHNEQNETAAKLMRKLSPEEVETVFSEFKDVYSDLLLAYDDGINEDPFTSAYWETVQTITRRWAKKKGMAVTSQEG